MSTNTAHILDGLTASNLSVAVLPRPASKAMEIVGIANCANMMVGPTLSALLAHLFHSGSCAGARSRSQASRSTSLSALRDKALRSARSRKLALRVLSLALLAAALSAFAFVGELGRRRGRRDFRRSAGTPPPDCRYRRAARCADQYINIAIIKATCNIAGPDRHGSVAPILDSRQFLAL
jgi:hypothetical protein